MIHDYEYGQAIPYEYVIYRKLDKVEFTEEIKSKLDNYYRDIRKLAKKATQVRNWIFFLCVAMSST